MKFCIGVGVPDVITHANFGDDRFRCFGGAGVEFPTFLLTSAVALNTLWQVIILKRIERKSINSGRKSRDFGNYKKNSIKLERPLIQVIINQETVVLLLVVCDCCCCCCCYVSSQQQAAVFSANKCVTRVCSARRC